MAPTFGQVLSRVRPAKGAQPARLGPMSAPFGSRLNYFFFAFWLFMAYAGWAIALGSLSALQHYENHSGLSDGTNGWAIKSNFPNLNSGRVFRLDWFILFLQFITISLISMASISKLIPTVRLALVGYLAATVVLQIISADRFYNLSHFHVSKAYFSSSRGSAAGFIIAATSDFALMYLLGIVPPPPPPA